MSERVEVPFEGKASEKATLLLAAAEELDLPADVVQTGTGVFLVPAEVEKQAFGERREDKSESTAKKAAAKKAAPKKAQE